MPPRARADAPVRPRRNSLDVQGDHRRQPRHQGAVDPGVEEARQRLSDLAAEQSVLPDIAPRGAARCETNPAWTFSPSIRIGTLSCLENAIAALSLMCTGLYSGVSPLCASAMPGAPGIEAVAAIIGPPSSYNVSAMMPRLDTGGNLRLGWFLGPVSGLPGGALEVRQVLPHLADVRPRVVFQRAEAAADVEHGELVRRELRAEFVPATGVETVAPGRARVE